MGLRKDERERKEEEVGKEKGTESGLQKPNLGHSTLVRLVPGLLLLKVDEEYNYD